jgi:tRNA-specific 2-thiouridylase
MPDNCDNNKKVLLGMSGGLDSTISAILLKNAGYKVTGLSLKFWHLHPQERESAIEKAATLAKQIGIEHHIMDVQSHFKDEVVDYFCDEYLSGRTPNPCNRCNPLVKWPALIQKADELGCHYVATGHYVQKDLLKGQWVIKKGADKTKDQSYFLWNLNQKILEKALFPLGKISKAEVREMALKYNLTEAAHQQESMGVCFLGKTNYRDYLKSCVRSGTMQIDPGDIITETGQIVGKHQGIPFFTIGQKKGLDLTDKDYFVTKLHAHTNQLVISKSASLKTKSLLLTNYQITIPLAEDQNLKVYARVRGIDQVPEIQADICIKKSGLQVNFKTAAWAITPGQNMVFYQNDCVIGGGIV